MKRPNWKLYKLMTCLELGFIILSFIGMIILSHFLLDSTFPTFKYSLLWISIITCLFLIGLTIGLIIVIKRWRNSSLNTLSNYQKIRYSLLFLLLSFFILSSLEYLIYINNKDNFNIENKYVRTAINNKIDDITNEIKYCKKYADKYSNIYDKIKNKELLGYNNTDDFYFTVINGDTLEIEVHNKKPLPGGTNGIYTIEGIYDAENIGILLKNEPRNISYPTSKAILESMQQNDSINGNDFRLLVHNKIKMYQDRIEKYKMILENEVVITFGDFVIYNVFNPSITGNKTHIFIRLIFFLQAIVVTFFSGYIYQTFYKILDGEEFKGPKA